MMNLKEATDEEVKLAKVNAIKNLVGDQAEQFNLDSMSPEDLDSLFAELSKAHTQESVEDVVALGAKFNEAFAIYALQQHFGFKESEAKIIYEESLCE